MKKFVYLLIVLFLILIGYFTVIYIKEENSITYKKNLTINVGENIPTIYDYVEEDKKIKDEKIKWNNIKIEDNKVYYAGNYSGTFKFKKKKINIKLKVVDKEAPIIDGVKDIEIYEKEKVDLLKNIKANDNSHDKLKIEIEGKYNLDKKGEYSLKYVVSDSSNNTTKKEFKLKVKEKKVEKKDTTNQNNTNNILTKSTKGYTIEVKNGIYYVGGVLIANKTYSLPSNYNPGGLLSVFMNNYNKMKNESSKAGINLKIISGFRSYNTQKTLYNNYVARDGKTAADRYSARAGHSEHQTGLAADINSLEQSFVNTKEGKWLNENCYKYGFIIRYPKGKENITGYMYEPWHIRYVGVDIATKLYNNGNWITLEEYLGIDSKYR